MSRAAHEARWTHDDARVKGRTRRNGWWVLLLAVALVIGLAIFGYQRWWAFETVAYETKVCEQPLTEDSTWADVEAAGCRPTDVADLGQVVVYNQLDRSDMSARLEPASIEGAVTTYDDIAVNSPAHYLELDTTQPVDNVVVAVPADQEIRRAMTSDASRTDWGVPIGSGGATHYWLLITP